MRVLLQDDDRLSRPLGSGLEPHEVHARRDPASPVVGSVPGALVPAGLERSVGERPHRAPRQVVDRHAHRLLAWQREPDRRSGHERVGNGLETDEIEADLDRLPAPLPGRPIDYAPVGDATVERLRGVGGVAELPGGASRPAPTSRAFDGFRGLAGRETGIHGVWIRQIVLENPRRP